jgi:hypothetical protein
MSIFGINNCFWVEILIFRFENNNLQFKYQILDQIKFLNLNNNFQNWNVNFQIQVTIFKTEMSILESNNNFQTRNINFEHTN